MAGRRFARPIQMLTRENYQRVPGLRGPPSRLQVEHRGMMGEHSVYQLRPGAARSRLFGVLYNHIAGITPSGTMISRAAAREAVENGAGVHYAQEGKLAGAATHIPIEVSGRASHLHIGYLTGDRAASEALIHMAIDANNRENGRSTTRVVTAEAAGEREEQHLENIGFQRLGEHQQPRAHGLQGRNVSIWARPVQGSLGNEALRQAMLTRVRQTLYG